MKNWLTRVISAFYYRVVIVRGVRYYVKYVAAWVILAAYVALAFLMRHTAPLWPVTYYTPMWVVSFLFPATASAYLMYNLGMRLDEIQDAVQRRELYCIYFPKAGKDDAEQLFARFLMHRFREFYNPWEFASFSILAGCAGFLSLFLLGKQLGLPAFEAPFEVLPIPTDRVGDWVLLVSAGFLGATSGALVMIYRKYRAFDVYPSTYLHATIALVLGTLAAGFLSTTLGFAQVRFVAFAIGFLTALNVNFLSDLIVDRSKIAGLPAGSQVPSDLAEIVQNGDAIKSLQDLSLCSVSELVKSEPIILYLNLPQPIGVINGWIDEGLLHYYFRPQLARLRDANIRRFTQLVQMLVERFEARGAVWRDATSLTGDGALDGSIVAAVRSVVDGRLHHTVLAILWEKYRTDYFQPSFTVTGPPAGQPGIITKPVFPNGGGVESHQAQ